MSGNPRRPETIGTPAYENWKRADEGIPSQFAFEFPLFTDAYNIVSEVVEGLGPYKLINTLPNPFISGITPAVVLRLEYHQNDTAWNKPNDTYKTDTERYHGGLIQEEIAALLSLCLGIRLKAGGESRIFEPGGDPRGRPVTFEISQNPYLRKVSQSRPVLPRVLGEVNISEAKLLEYLPKLLPPDEIALMRAARLYQEAIWIAEFEPERSWVMLVSAIEVAANRWRNTSEPALELLRSSIYQNLEEILKKSGGNDLVLTVAEQMAPFLGSTAKFRDFVVEYLPEPPADRPPQSTQVQWDREWMKKSMGLIYEYRSRALHDGIPFPAPMCEPPKQWDNNKYSERPIGLATRTQSATWAAKDTPMLLHTFEFIVRNCLINWWRTLVINETKKSTQSSLS